jgi:hypothetical protein
MFKPTVVIIGAGPFGLSIAAYLQSFGVNFRIFGTPMHRWRAQMPKGMFLKSEAFASNLADPSGQYTLQEYCAEKALPYGIAPVPIETFSRYALSYQQRRIPMVEDTFVTALDRGTDAFKLLLATGEEIRTRKVVIATGLSHAAYIPNGLKKLPLELLSHSSDHHDLSQFKGRDVIVIGAGQSALETAALLNECQAKVRLLVRRPSIEWNPLPTLGLRSLWQQLRRPQSALGSGFRTRFCANTPQLFYRLPTRIRTDWVHQLLGPAGAWWLRDRVVGRLPIALGHSVRGAEVHGSKLVLHVQDPDEKLHEFVADHVIAATGYSFDARSLPFLSQGLLHRLRLIERSPWLSPSFESSVPGLYFTGLASAYQFGPVMRFLYGAHYTAQSVSRDIARGRKRAIPVAPTSESSSRIHY